VSPLQRPVGLCC